MKIKLLVGKEKRKKLQNLFIYITRCLTISLGVIIICLFYRPFTKYKKSFVVEISTFLCILENVKMLF